MPKGDKTEVTILTATVMPSDKTVYHTPFRGDGLHS